MRDHDSDANELPGVALAELPMLDMRVGVFGSTRHAEVGGQVCFGSVITLAIFHGKG